MPPSDVIATARPAVFWTDNAGGPEPAPPLLGPHRADLVIVGGGYTGLWAALQALEDQPGRSVTVLEAEVCGFGASSRNGGFCSASLTHGLGHGVSQWPEDKVVLRRLGQENLTEIEATLDRYGIDADFRRTGQLEVATEHWQLEEIEHQAEVHREMRSPIELLDAHQTRALLDSPTYLGGLLMPVQTALVDPARLVWGLRAAVEQLGGVVCDHSRVRSVERTGGADASPSGLVVTTDGGAVEADRVIVATNAYRGPAKRIGRYMIPVYDHVLMTEPLSDEQLASVGWHGRQGVGDAANQFHYYRLSADNRILWGGYDATYHFNNGTDPSFDLRDETHRTLADHFHHTFPQLADVAFTHRWGGPIATTSQFTCTWGTEHGGRLAWVAGYTGLGVGASRFGARVALDLVDGIDSERTSLAMVRKKPFPFPPEPARSLVVAMTKRAIQRADRNQGRRGPWLRLLDRFGIGFDS